MARSAGLQAEAEESHLIPGTQYRPADTCIRHGHGLGDGLIACYDVVQTGNTAPSNRDIAARYPGAMRETAMNRKLNTLAKRVSSDSNLVAVPFDSQGALHEIWVGAYEAWSNRYVTIGPNASLPDPANARLRGAFVRRSLATTSLRIQRSQHHLVERMCESAFRSVHGVPRAARILDAADLGFDYVAHSRGGDPRLFYPAPGGGPGCR